MATLQTIRIWQAGNPDRWSEQGMAVNECDLKGWLDKGWMQDNPYVVKAVKADDVKVVMPINSTPDVPVQTALSFDTGPAVGTATLPLLIQAAPGTPIVVQTPMSRPSKAKGRPKKAN